LPLSLSSGLPYIAWGMRIWSRCAQDDPGGITLVVFCGFSAMYLKEPLRWNAGAGFILLTAAAFLLLEKRSQPAPVDRASVRR